MPAKKKLTPDQQQLVENAVHEHLPAVLARVRKNPRLFFVLAIVFVLHACLYLLPPRNFQLVALSLVFALLLTSLQMPRVICALLTNGLRDKFSRELLRHGAIQACADKSVTATLPLLSSEDFRKESSDARA